MSFDKASIFSIFPSDLQLSEDVSWAHTNLSILRPIRLCRLVSVTAKNWKTRPRTIKKISLSNFSHLIF